MAKKEINTIKLIENFYEDSVKSGYFNASLGIECGYTARNRRRGCKFIQYPKEYFQYLNYSLIPFSKFDKKREYSLYLSKKGWNFFKPEMEKVFVPSPNQYGYTCCPKTWPDYVKLMEEHFKKVEENMNKFFQDNAEKLNIIQKAYYEFMEE